MFSPHHRSKPLMLVLLIALLVSLLPLSAARAQSANLVFKSIADDTVNSAISKKFFNNWDCP